MKRWHTTDELADALGETSENISRRCAAGQIPATKVGNRWRIAEDDFERWMQPNNVKTSPRVRSTVGRRRSA
jgi:excisionase family DNA binding protein